MTGNEEWRPIPGYPGYLASNLGRVASCRQSPTPRLLIGGSNQRGYRIVKLRTDTGAAHTRTVHRIIAEVFIGPLPEGLQVRHLDGDRLNNATSNLRYGTPSENVLDQVAHGVHFFASRTHCKRGHAFDAENTAINVRGHRVCRACVRLLNAERAA